MTIDELQVVVTANTNQLKSELAKVRGDLGKLDSTTSGVASRMPKHFGVMSTVASAFGNVIANVVTGAFRAMGSSVGDAVSRLDTIKNYPRVMSNLGISTDQASKSIAYMSDKLIGLPTTIDSAVASVQRFTSVNGNINASTEMFLALNNAILAGGANAQVRASAVEQLSQSYAKGKPDMMEWRSAMTAMPAQLAQVAKAMGKANASQLGDSLRDGSVSMNDFMKKLVELNKTGANGFQSFEQQARNATGGVGTSMINVKTAFVRGLANIMDAIGQANIAGFFQMIVNAINAVVPYVVAFVRLMVTAVTWISSLFGGGKKKADGMTKAVDATATSMAGVGAGANDASDAIDGATGSAKKLKNQLASFDEMNVLTAPDASGGGGGGAGGGGAGGLGDMGLDIPTPDTSGLDKVSKIVDSIKDKLKIVGDVMKTIWNSAPVQAFAGLVGARLNFIWQLVSQVGVAIWDNLVTTWTLIEPNVMLTLTNIVAFFTLFWTQMTETMNTYTQPIVDGVVGMVTSLLDDVFTPYAVLITQVWADMSSTLLSTWTKYGGSILDGLGKFVVNTIALFQSIWDNVLAPIIKPFLEMLTTLWNEHIKGMVDQVADFVGKLVVFALAIYNNFIAPIVKFLLEFLKPAFAFIGAFISGIFGTIFGTIADVVGSIFKVLGGLIDFLTGIFTGNWRQAWGGVVSIFSGIFGGIVAIAKAPLNILIDLINSFISGINAIKIPDWVPGVGGKSLNIGKIPKLAKGGIIDSATLAVVGESGKEAVMPLENNTGWIDLLASKLNAQSGGGGVQQITVKIGEDTLIRKVVDGINDLSYQNGEAVIAL